MDKTDDKTPSFVLAQKPADFWWTVKIPIPGDDDYSFASLRVRYHPVDQTELDKMRGVGLAEGEAAPTDTEIVHRVVVGMGLKDETGETVAFTPELLDQVLRAPMVRTAMVGTYLAVMGGVAARKNV